MLAGFALALWLAGILATRYGTDRASTRKIVEYSAWIGLAGARLGFVLLNWDAYREAPWSILFFWQPGYLFSSGIACGGAFALWHIIREVSARRRSLLVILGASYLVAGTLFLGGNLILGLLAPDNRYVTGDPAPRVSMQNLAGEKVQLSDLVGGGVILNFWATWCPPCRREMPMLEAIHRAHAEKGLSVIGLAVDEPPGQVRRYVESIGITYPIWTDADRPRAGLDRSQAIFSRIGGVGLPTTLFIDRRGFIRRIYVGELSRGFVENELRTILAR